MRINEDRFATRDLNDVESLASVNDVCYSSPEDKAREIVEKHLDGIEEFMYDAYSAWAAGSGQVMHVWMNECGEWKFEIE